MKVKADGRVQEEKTELHKKGGVGGWETEVNEGRGGPYSYETGHQEEAGRIDMAD